MTSNKNLKIFFNQYEDIIQTGFQYDYSEKEIFNAIYSKEFNNYLRKGWHPRLDELNYVMNFVRKFRSGDLDYNIKSQSNSNQKSEIEIIRDNIHNLDLTKKDDYEVYKSARFEFIASEENGKLKNFIEKMKKNNTNYYDTEIMSNKSNELIQIVSGNPTIGYGFDTITSGGQKEWNDAFLEYNKNNPYNRIEIPNMNDIINLKRGMTPRELEIITNHSMNIRNNKLSNKIGQDIWNKLKANERIALESAFYNGETIVGKNQKELLSKYVQTSNSMYLESAVNDLKTSSDVKNPELKNRRNRESVLLDSTQSSLYSKPSEAPLPEKYKNKYFKWIWSGNSNSKNSNPYHRDVLNGEIFKIDSDPWKWMTSKRLKGCHCTYEIVD